MDIGPLKQQSVLAALLLRAGKSVSLDEITDFVWGDEGPVSTVNVIQTYVRRLRDVFEPERASGARKGRIRTVGSGFYAARLGEEELDLLRFRALVERAGRAHAGQDTLLLLLEALDLWRGACLGSSRQEHPWVRAVNQERASAAVAAVAAARRCDAMHETVPRLRAVAADEPLNEPLHAHLMLAMAETGAQSEAVSVYEGIRRRLADEFGVDPSPTLRNAYQEVIGRIVSSRRPVGGIESGIWRGPPPALDGLVGREEDLKQLTQFVTDRRIVTITGPGGVGKTAMALAVADRLAGHYRDGVAVAELGLLAPEQVGDRGEERLEVMADTLCALLDVPVRAAGALESLIRAVHDRAMLIVLDNAEHVTATVARLMDHLRRVTPAPHILITTRRPVGMPDETIWDLEPLPVPPPDAGDPSGFPAVELYLRRAKQHVPTVDLSDNLGVVAELCRRLEGLPLGIELATGRLRSISPTVLLHRIDGWLGVLTRPGRQGLPHQRTLASTVQWSLDLLGDDARLLLYRLAVFTGGFDLEAAERVAGFAPLSAERVAGTLTELIDHSLVQVVRGEEYRYRLLAPVRDTCRALADNSDNADLVDMAAARDRHLRFSRGPSAELATPARQAGARTT
ncbi:putative ATPase/DNA-binding SARP family transcriptional activator [Nonomuraea thailandensis]|uniref:ATPase/DNA-binding SARP family transcriptional activator n=1 Tax=Nonomuraea thailandensis TaxID=1188745 RepID=A0A9X2G914_9ACTN|nr:BTAD domain-containing putative transcriptional regulator [Nonomuraea thailandensis]MCP2353475.1 putative ATPase/DNA-binding SARP family transcriptional activator [Nonomuraea thailandensis]